MSDPDIYVPNWDEAHEELTAHFIATAFLASPAGREYLDEKPAIERLRAIEWCAIQVCEARAEGIPYQGRLDKLHAVVVAR